MPPLTGGTELDSGQSVEGGDGIFVIRGSGNCRSWNNIQYKAGMSARNVGSGSRDNTDLIEAVTVAAARS